MAIALKGVMQAPVTPLNDDFSLDIPTFERMVDFHIRHDAPAIAWPHHKAESLNMTVDERKRGAEAAVKTAAGRAPVSIFVSALAITDTIELARHAEKIGADAILLITPYCWAPSPDEIFDYVVRMGTMVDLPLLAYNSPGYLEGVEFTGELVGRLIQRLPNFIGMKDASFNSEKFLDISSVALELRPGFAMITGVEFLLPSIPLGGVGSFSAAGAISPNLCNDLYDACVAEDWPRARAAQYKITRLWTLFREQYPSSLKGAMAMMGRPVGPTRSPLPTATPERQDYLRQQLDELGILASEPHGW
jgi:dihydrodipicolinate synthase/N-acetylneuraminate lyase